MTMIFTQEEIEEILRQYVVKQLIERINLAVPDRDKLTLIDFSYRPYSKSKTVVVKVKRGQFKQGKEA